MNGAECIFALLIFTAFTATLTLVSVVYTAIIASAQVSHKNYRQENRERK